MRPVAFTLLGQPVHAYAFFLCVGLRFVLEYVRDDVVGPEHLGLYRYPWTSLLMAAGGAALLARLRR